MTDKPCDAYSAQPAIEIKSGLTRRSMLKAAAVGLAALGFSGIAESAMAASKQYKAGKASAIAVKGGRSYTINGQYVLITQPKKGVYRAFNGICTHQRGVRITGLQGSNLICTQHMAMFNYDSGKVTQGPAEGGGRPIANLTKYTVTNKSGVLYISM